MLPTDGPLTPSGCDDHRRTLHRARLARRAAATAVPLPDEALAAGAERFLGATTSRRGALAGGAGLMLALSGLRLGKDPRHLLELAVEDAQAAGPAPILVLVYQAGGNDGLNTLVPTGGPDATIYNAQRRRIGLDADLLPLGGANPVADLAWHPSFGGVRDLYDAGKVAVLPAVDYPQPNLSHFHSARFWRTGVTDFSVDTGWLGRYLDIAGGQNPLQGVAVRWGTDDVLLARHAPTCAVFSPSDFDLWTPGVWDDDPVTVIKGLRRLAKPSRTRALRRAVEVSHQSYDVWKALQPLRGGDEPPKPTTLGYPQDDGLSEGFANLGRMLSANLGIRVATLEADGGWDSHENQKADQAENLRRLGGSLAAWQADIERRGLADRVLTVVWSEFGRRVEDNDSQGTDHGAGGLVLGIGNHVRAGVHHDSRRTSAPGWNLRGFDSDAWEGNVPVGIDFRDVYAGILQGHLGVEAGRVLPRYRGRPLQVVA